MPMRRIAVVVGRSVATVSHRFLAGLGLSSLKALDPVVPTLRYEREAPGELLHIDTKKLGRIVRPSHRVTGDRRDSVEGAGWEFAHVAIDDHSRVGFVQMRADEKKGVGRGLPGGDGGALPQSRRHSQTTVDRQWQRLSLQGLQATCKALGIKHTYTRPHRPQTNGKAERFIQTCLREWAYGRVWNNSAERTAWLPSFLAYYNTRRPHSAFGPPASSFPAQWEEPVTASRQVVSLSPGSLSRGRNKKPASAGFVLLSSSRLIPAGGR